MSDEPAKQHQLTLISEGSWQGWCGENTNDSRSPCDRRNHQQLNVIGPLFLVLTGVYGQVPLIPGLSTLRATVIEWLASSG